MYTESDALADGLYVDASEKYPVECERMGVRFRTVFTLACSEACVVVVVSSVEAEPLGPSESGRLLRFLDTFRKEAPVKKNVREVFFSVEVMTNRGAPCRHIVEGKIGLWDGEPDRPFLLFLLEGQD